VPVAGDGISAVTTGIDPTIDAGIRLVPTNPGGPGGPPPGRPGGSPPHHGRPHGPGYPCVPGDYDPNCDPGHGGGAGHHRHGGQVKHEPRLLPGCGCDDRWRPGDPDHRRRCHHDDRSRPLGDRRREDCCFEPRREHRDHHRRDCPQRRPDVCTTSSESTTEPMKPNGC
jgi:hypothetical protein